MEETVSCMQSMTRRNVYNTVVRWTVTFPSISRCLPVYFMAWPKPVIMHMLYTSPRKIQLSALRCGWCHSSCWTLWWLQWWPWWPVWSVWALTTLVNRSKTSPKRTVALWLKTSTLDQHAMDQRRRKITIQGIFTSFFMLQRWPPGCVGWFGLPLSFLELSEPFGIVDSALEKQTKQTLLRLIPLPK